VRLAISRRVAEKHQGNIEVTSQPGHGAASSSRCRRNNLHVCPGAPAYGRRPLAASRTSANLNCGRKL
jgi:hypothetical protein